MRSARKLDVARTSKIQVAKAAVLVLSGLFFDPSAGSAVTIANHDEKEHKLTIIEGEAKTDQSLKPQQSLEKICPKGCVVRLNDSEDDEYQLDPDDMVSIEDGYLYHDTPDTSPAAPAPPQPTPTPQPGAQPPAKQ